MRSSKLVCPEFRAVGLLDRGRRFRMTVALILEEGMSEKGKYRTFTLEEKAEIVLAGLCGDRTVRDICREYEIAETLCYQWRDRLLEGGKAASATPRI